MYVLKLKNVFLSSLLLLLTITLSAWEDAYAQHSGISCTECCINYQGDLSECSDNLFSCSSTVDNIVRFGVNSQFCTFVVNTQTELLCAIVVDSGVRAARDFCSTDSQLCTSRAISRSQICINRCNSGQQTN